jgi:hypothetical protein
MQLLAAQTSNEGCRRAGVAAVRGCVHPGRFWQCGADACYLVSLVRMMIPLVLPVSIL